LFFGDDAFRLSTVPAVHVQRVIACRSKSPGRTVDVVRPSSRARVLTVECIHWWFLRWKDVAGWRPALSR